MFIFSSSAGLFPKTFLIQRLVVPIILSHHPSHQAARGAMNFQVMPHCAKLWDVCGSFKMAHISASSRQAAWNVAALSE